MGRKRHLEQMTDDDLLRYERVVMAERVAILTEKAIRAQLDERSHRRLTAERLRSVPSPYDHQTR